MLEELKIQKQNSKMAATPKSVTTSYDKLVTYMEWRRKDCKTSVILRKGTVGEPQTQLW